MATTGIRRIDLLRESIAPFLAFFNGPFAKLNAKPEIANFAVGNPQEMPLPEYVERAPRQPRAAATRLVRLQDDSEPKSRLTVAARPVQADRHGLGPGRRGDDQRRLRGPGRGDAGAGRARRRGDLPLAAVVLLRVHDPGGRWRAGPRSTSPRRPSSRTSTPSQPPSRPRTRAVIFNSPHNPSGRVYPVEDARARWPTIARRRRSARIGHPIYMISDEPYNRIVFDGREFHSPGRGSTRTRSSPTRTGSTLLAPGPAHRLPDRAAHACRSARRSERPSSSQQLATGYCLPQRPAPALRSRTWRSSRSTSAPCSGRRDRLVGGAARDRLRDDHAGGHLLRHGPRPDRGRRGLRRHPRHVTGCWCCPARAWRCPAGSGSA